MSEPATILNQSTVRDGLTVTIADRGPVGQITLRGDLADPAFGKAVAAATGVGMPAPLTAAFDGDAGAVWMSPDEVLLFVAYAEAEARTADLTSALAGQHHMAINVSDARAVISIEGPGARELMAKGAPLDVSDSAFPVGTARRTHFAEIAVGLWRTGDEAWQVVCFQSYAQHLFDWLVASAGEGSAVGYF